MIKRDQDGIIVQQAEKGLDLPGYADGGDSASRTGIMSLCGSEQDQELIDDFYVTKNCLPVRHPEQVPYNDPKEMSRDQLICLAAGAYNFNSDYNDSLIYWYHNNKSWFLNKDFLSPSHWFHIYCCCHADRNPDLRTIIFRYISSVFLLADVLWSTKIKPNDEQNQIICMLIVRGPWWLKLYVNWHPNYEKNLLDYWAKWRDQPEIAQALINKIKTCIS